MTALRKGEATSARMVEAMLSSIQSRGYAGTGINTVLEEASAPKGSMYFHFPGGKEELAERAVELAAAQFRDLFAEATTNGTGPAEVLTGALDVIAEMLTEADFALGCPVSVVTLEMGAHSERLRTACVMAYESWITPIADYLSSHGLAPDAARELAETVISTVEGAMIVSRARRDTASLRSAGRVLAAMLTSATATRGAAA